MPQKKNKLEAQNSKPPIIIDMPDLDEKSIFLIGWPGYRNARGRSGLGYMESQAELAHMQGLMIRWMFTGKFRTHNPIYLLVMFMFGLLCGVAPIVAIFVELTILKNYAILGFVLVASPYMALGVALFTNTILSIWDWGGQSITGD